MDSRTARKSRTSTPKPTKKPTGKPQPDSKQLWELATRWHETVRGMLFGIRESAHNIAFVVENTDHPLAAIFDFEDFPEFIRETEQAIAALVNIMPPAVCPIELPDPLAIC
jgi:hypothetical protein